MKRGDHFRDPVSPDYIQKLINVLGIVQGSSSGILIVFYVVNKYALVTKAKWRDFVNANKKKYVLLPNTKRLSVKEMSIEQTHLILLCKGPEADEFNIDKEKKDFGNAFTRSEFTLFNWYFFLQDGILQYYVLYFGISCLGFFTHEIYYSFHLLDVVVRVPTLTNVIRSVTSNADQLLMTGLLALVIIYIFTTISFFYLQDTIYDYDINLFESDWVGENRCISMISCFITMLDKGLILGGGIGDYTEAVHYADEPQKYFVKLFHDASFHIIVKVILLNILFGIIIDTFAQLREKKRMIDQDKKNKCFICNFDRFTFDKNSEGGFERHIAKDHNLW